MMKNSKKINVYSNQENMTLLEQSCKDLSLGHQWLIECIYNEITTLVEAELSQDQIRQVFKNVENNLNAAGTNRTLVGKAVDAAAVANKIIDRIGGYLQDTTPVKAFDQKFEELKAKVSAKYPNLENYLTKLGGWAKENPGKTAAVVGILTALAAIGGGPAGGAIAGQVLRGAVELMKGEKASTAVGKGLKTAALGYLSGKAVEMIGDYFQGMREKVLPVPNAENSGLKKITYTASEKIQAQGLSFDRSLSGFNVTVLPKEAETIHVLINNFKNGDFNGWQKLIDFGKMISSNEYQAKLADILGQARADQLNNDSILNWIKSLKQVGQSITQGAIAAAGVNKDGAQQRSQSLGEKKITNKGPNITEYRAKLNMKAVAKNQVINDGIVDTMKGAAGKAAAWAQAKGKNISVKVIADKLIKSWEMAGQPTNSYELAQWLESQVAKELITRAVTALGMDNNKEIENLQQFINLLPNENLKRLINQALSDQAAATKRTLAGAAAHHKQGTPMVDSAKKTQPLSEKNITNKGGKLTELHAKLAIKLAAKNQMITEGMWDTIKGAAGKAAGWAKTKAGNITANITADKLQKSWEKAGKPMDSDKLAIWLRQQGIAPDVVNQTFSSLGINPPMADADDNTETFKDLKSNIANLSPEQAKQLLKHMEDEPQPSTTRGSAAADFAAAIAKNDINAARKAIGDGSKLDNPTKTKIRSNIEKSKLPLYYKRLLLKDLGKNVGHWMKESFFRTISKILMENHLTWRDLGIHQVYRNKETQTVALLEFASGGSTSAGNVASVANPGGAMMPMIRRMPAGQSFFGAQHAGTKKPKKKAKKR